MVHPKTMWQQVCESHERFPAGGSLSQSAIESRVDHEVFPKSTGNRPKITDCVPLVEWLREMPDLPGDYEFAKGMGNGQCLSELGSTYICLNLLGNYSVCVDVKSMHLVAKQYRAGLSKGANIEFWRDAYVDAPDITDRKGWPRFAAAKQHALHTGEHFSLMHRSLTVGVTDYERLRLHKELQSGEH
jgi:hypothetical protein